MSSNAALIPHPTVTYTSPGATGSLSYTPVANASGTATITVTVSDGVDTITRTFTVTVNAVNDAPTAGAGGPYGVDEGSSVAVAASGSDIDGDPLTFAWDLDNNGGFETPGQNVSFTGLDGPVSQTVTVKVTDSGGAWATAQATVQVRNVAPAVGAVTAPVDPVPVSTAVNASATFTDPGTPDTHTAVWAWGDGNTSSGAVNEETGSVSGSHTYAAAGVYRVTLTVTDDDGASDEAAFQFVVIYDPTAGFVTGGGWIDSPVGAYPANPSLTGKANFGFVAKYQKGASVPTGQTQFNFKVASLNFQSTAYEWLVVAGARAKFKGSGTINNSGDYGFMLTATDGQANGGGGVDKFWIKVWNKGTGGVIYDNQMGADDDADATDAIEGGSIVIHNGGAAKPVALARVGEAGEDAPAVPEAFGLDPNYPNPFNPATTIRYTLPEAAGVTLVVYNILGQQVRTLVSGSQGPGYHAVVWDGRDEVGRQVASGLYLYRLQAGTFVQVRKMLFAK
ncbi:MAG: hypothetical protein A3F84_08320 [Candidatus Handelsmanbacteria bacterium RIFCSPLOWO2_12_FULL_64_10]|uniref:PKD domain-containing protein n=1 Tax=Handelsmanbacteria sp. (strain RIFCSPLOWO2_12_FULL_64_10) TaxID=1817868 RepID=A0A1F6D1A2_HANXR|nr:MAG: hypothetical protein A3F84_08320 [Candidatus Handelsmanbacteria bacterium RIFCSPLOWO2_12_FULL_64_10]